MVMVAPFFALLSDTFKREHRRVAMPMVVFMLWGCMVMPGGAGLGVVCLRRALSVFSAQSRDHGAIFRPRLLLGH